MYGHVGSHKMLIVVPLHYITLLKNYDMDLS